MRKAAEAVFFVLCLTAFVSTVHAGRAEDCQALADKALEMFKSRGIEATLKALNSQNVLTDKEIYVFALTIDNTVVAHPYKPSLVGANLNDETDANGKYYAREFTSVVMTKGSGWVQYWWRRPGEKKPRLKRTYVVRVPGRDLYIGIGYYSDITSLSKQ
jgi:signal transduction histidine kinase